MIRKLSFLGSDFFKGHYIDVAWKTVLFAEIEEAIKFFLPELAKDMDPSRPVDWAPLEFFPIDGESDIGKRITDLSFIVPLKGGGSKRRGLFVEQQNENKQDFGLRAFQIFYRMRDKLNEEVTALAIFTGRAKDINEYSYSSYGVNLSFKYNTYRVLDQDMDELRRDKRMFAVVVLAARMVVEAKGKPLKREQYAWELIKILRERDYSAIHRRRIIKFFKNVLRLDSSDISEELKGELNMILVPVSKIRDEIDMMDAKEEGMIEGKIEGKKEGKIEGKIEAMMEVAKNLLKKGVSMEIIVESTGLDREDILALG